MCPPLTNIREGASAGELSHWDDPTGRVDDVGPEPLPGDDERLGGAGQRRKV